MTRPPSAVLLRMALHRTEPAVASATSGWLPVCPLEDIAPNTGVCALLAGQQIAVIRVGAGDQVHAISNFDPFSKAFVMSRGIVGDRNGVPKIASPMYKQSFDLRTGACLDDPAVSIPRYQARIRDGHVEVLLAQADE